MRGTSSSKAAKNISTETATVIEILETLSSVKRKFLTDKVREWVSEEKSEQEWDEMLSSHPQPMIKMAERALKESRAGKSQRMKL